MIKLVRKKNQVLKKICFLLFSIVFIVVLGIYYKNYFMSSFNVDVNEIDEKDEEIEYIFIEKGITLNRSDLYSYDGETYKIIGQVNSNLIFEFSELQDEYLLIDGFNDNYYIKSEDVKEVLEEKIKSQRYNEYILFNENIITNDISNFYDENGNLLYKFYLSFDLPIIIKDDNKYGVEFNNQLLYVYSADVKSIKESNNTDMVNSRGIGVLNYHFFYDENNEKEREECNKSICESVSQFRSELDYLKENDILTITTKELEWYIDGKVNLPKSVLITIDDGYMMSRGIDLLEEYQMYGCVFLITSWFDNINFKNSYDYVEFHSHGEKLHSTGVCPGGQGGGIKCLPKEQILSDLKTSSEKLGGTKVFAYPFYDYNDYSIEVLKEAGFTMAFAGESNNSDNLVHVGSNKYELPRFVVVSYTTKSDLDKYFSKLEGAF